MSVLFLSGCASFSPYIKELHKLDSTHLALPDVSVSIPNLSSCTDSDDKTLEIDSTSPITVLVHGCNGSAGRFRSLAQLYAFHGQQAVCYSYDDRDSLLVSADKLAASIGELANITNNQKVSIVGHSMGGLIARKAVEENGKNPGLLSDNEIELVTISAPFSGISAANHCGVEALHWLSLGVVPGICWVITGNNWDEITFSSDFITQPESLLPSVQKYLKVVTNEKNTCRKRDRGGECIESDDIFSLSEQYQAAIDNYPNMTGVQVDAGHVEIVGSKNVVPRKLLSILQENGMLPLTLPNRRAALERLLADLY